MRILIDAKLLGKGGTTGVSGYTKEMVSALLANTPHDYRLFYNGFNMNPLPTEWLNNPRVSTLNWHIPNKLLQVIMKIPPAFGVLPLEKGEDLIFSPHFHLLPSGNIPRVVTFHDLSFIHYPQFFSPKQRIWHWWQNYAKQAREARHIIAVSEYTKADLVNILKIPAEKITVIYSGISSEFKKLSTENLELRTRPYFLFVGTLEPRKNIPTLIKAFTLLKKDPQFKDYELVIAGRPGYRSGEYFGSRTSPSSVRFLNNVSDSDRPLLYNNARVFVFPSFFEGFGFPPLEAQACGTPVIASDRTSLPEILGDSALYFNPWKIGELAELMAKVATDNKLHQTLIARGLENVKKFTWESSAKQLNKVFESTV